MLPPQVVGTCAVDRDTPAAWDSRPRNIRGTDVPITRGDACRHRRLSTGDPSVDQAQRWAETKDDYTPGPGAHCLVPALLTTATVLKLSRRSGITPRGGV